MNPVTLVIIVKATIAIFSILVGLCAMWYGVGLYRSGVGLKSDGSTVELENAKVKLKTVESVLMLTSFSWG
jgi:hypothetical protein